MQNKHIEPILFEPAPGLRSPHLQTVFTCFTAKGKPPPSSQLRVALPDGDLLSCEVSTPPSWKVKDKIVTLLHGMGGDHDSLYMVRLSRKLYDAGYKTIRMNMRSCGSGVNLSTKPYHGGLSEDVFSFLQLLQKQYPDSPKVFIGFSLGGNIALKLAGELGDAASRLTDLLIAICPPINLAHSAHLLIQPKNLIYNKYYMHEIEKQAKEWIKGRPFGTIFEYDAMITAPIWGFKGPYDYYEKASCYALISRIKLPCHILFAEDDPFIDPSLIYYLKPQSTTRIWLSKYGGHMGFIGWSDVEHGYYWLDSQIHKWIAEL